MFQKNIHLIISGYPDIFAMRGTCINLLNMTTLEADILQLKQEIAAILVAKASFRKFPNETDRKNHLLDSSTLTDHPFLKIIYRHIIHLNDLYMIKEKLLAVLESQSPPDVTFKCKLTHCRRI